MKIMIFYFFIITAILIALASIAIITKWKLNQNEKHSIKYALLLMAGLTITVSLVFISCKLLPLIAVMCIFWVIYCSHKSVEGA